MRTLSEAILAGHLVWDRHTRIHSHSSGATVVESSSGVAVVSGPAEVISHLLEQARLGAAGVRSLLETHDPGEVEHLLGLCGNALRVASQRPEATLESGSSIELIGNGDELTELARRLANPRGPTCVVRPWDLDRTSVGADLVVVWVPTGIRLADVDDLERALRDSGKRFFLVASLGLGVLVGPGGLGKIGSRYVDAYAEIVGVPDASLVMSLVTRDLPPASRAVVTNVIEARLLDLLRSRELRGSGGRVDLVEPGGATSRRLVFSEYRQARDPSVDEASEQAHSWASVTEAQLQELASADRGPDPPSPSMEQMLAFLRSHGAVTEKDDGAGRTLLDHLVGAHRILTAWGCGHPFTTFGLFHSVYASQAIRRPLLSLHDRPLLRQLIGPPAEQLVFLFSTLDRQSLVQRIEARSGPGDLRNYVTGETLHCPELEKFFTLFELVNLCDLIGTPRAFEEISTRVRQLRGSRWLPPVFDHGRETVTGEDVARAIELSERPGDVLDALRGATELVPWWPEPHIRHAAELARIGRHAEARAHAQVGLERLLCWGTSFDGRATWHEWLLLANRLLSNPEGR